MGTLVPSSPLFSFNHSRTTNSSRNPGVRVGVSLKSPPLDFDYRCKTLDGSRSMVAEMHPELLDLVENGSLVSIHKSRFGFMNSHRKIDFAEPEMIWVIGTTHLSQESALDVERVVKAVKPENVVVELCRSRSGIMYSSIDAEILSLSKSNMFSLSGDGFFNAISRSLNLGGQTALVLRLLLAFFSSKISSNAGRPFGDEFRAARKASEAVGAQIVLGDRPIEITLGRAWASLKWSEKLGLVVSLLRGMTSPPSDMSSRNLKALIVERDVYLAWSLKRSKAVNNSKTVVGVIGKGHMNGVIYALMNDQGDVRFRDLVGKRPSEGTSNNWIGDLFKSLVRDTVIGILIWALFEQLKPGF